MTMSWSSMHTRRVTKEGDLWTRMRSGRCSWNPSKTSPRIQTISIGATTLLTAWKSLPDGCAWADFRPPSLEDEMQNYLVLAPAPIEEDCVCVGEEDYMPRARAECQRFIALLRKK